MNRRHNDYLTLAGDMLDAICHAAYGPRPGALEAVLADNPGLAAYGPVLPTNVTVSLPELGPAESSSQINLWD
ncbi:tail protein X [Veronia pacifica]|uniref:Phage tail protein n=1 Tax=Veronia pacifica TaxID=1080227 RepID=A0A1C3EBS0_9GAMM|nr:tail protein X [Veronia pacifica]ODA30634.1 hypothetical protein A8L45_19715 [Veronia pacifica]